jgi:hypothetical protein
MIAQPRRGDLITLHWRTLFAAAPGVPSVTCGLGVHMAVDNRSLMRTTVDFLWIPMWIKK